MATDRPRVQAYLEPETHERLKQWQEEHGLKESSALNEILKQFFGMSSEPSIPATPSIPQEDIEKIVRDEVNQLFRVQMEENAEFWTNRFSERLAHVEQSLERFINSSHRQIDELKGDLGERITILEEICQPIEGLAELSKPLSESLEDSLPEKTNWQIGDRVRVLCASSYQGMTGTIVKYEDSLGWGVAVDRWWEVAGIAESVIDDRQKRESNIWCDSDEIESIGDILEEKPVTPAEQEIESETQEETEDNEPSDSLSDLPDFLNAANLARRLGISKSVISRRKGQPDFEDWSKQHDPAGIGWRFPGKGQRFFPVCQ